MRGRIERGEADDSIRDLLLAGGKCDPRIADETIWFTPKHFGCELWTADEAFWREAVADFVWVRWVGEVVL